MLRRFVMKPLGYACLILASLIINVLIKIVPFKKLIYRFTNCPSAEENDLSDRKYSYFHQLDRGLEKVENVVPWRFKCLEKALMALLIARILKVNMNIVMGVKREVDGSLSAHAWTSAGGVNFTGFENSVEYSPLYKRGIDISKNI